MGLSSFLSSESGAVTVDWVVLTSALVGLGLATAGVVSGGIADLSGEIQLALLDTDTTVAWGEGGAGPGWGELSRFVWQNVEDAEQHMQGLLDYVYNNDVQALYDDVVSQLDAAILNNDLDAAHYNVDRLGYLQNYAATNNIQFSGDNQPSYSEMHAVVTAMTNS